MKPQSSSGNNQDEVDLGIKDDAAPHPLQLLLLLEASMMELQGMVKRVFAEKEITQ